MIHVERAKTFSDVLWCKLQFGFATMLLLLYGMFVHANIDGRFVVMGKCQIKTTSVAVLCVRRCSVAESR